MKAEKTNSLSARCAGACPFGRTFVCAKKAREVMVSLSGDFLEKGGKKNAKQECFRKKVHLFFGVVMWFRDISTFSCCKFRLFEIKDIPLLSINTTFPFPVALRRPYSATSKGFPPDESAQTLFDLLNTTIWQCRNSVVGR